MQSPFVPEITGPLDLRKFEASEEAVDHESSAEFTGPQDYLAEWSSGVVTLFSLDDPDTETGRSTNSHSIS